MASIGELVNVPEPGAQVASAWAQDVTNRAVHRFATVAAMNGWAAGNGSLAFATETGQHYRRVNNQWIGFEVPWTAFTTNPSWPSSDFINLTHRYLRWGGSILLDFFINRATFAGPNSILNFTLPFPALRRTDMFGTCTVANGSNMVLGFRAEGSTLTPFPLNAGSTYLSFDNAGIRGPTWDFGYMSCMGWYPVS